MFKPRKIESHRDWLDNDGIKIYTVSAKNQAVDRSLYTERLRRVKKEKGLVWSDTAAFTIFHDGAALQYLVLAWWDNENELFTSVSALTEKGWIEDPARFSFCLWDLEIIWHERNAFISNIYNGNPQINDYRASRFNSS